MSAPVPRRLPTDGRPYGHFPPCVSFRGGRKADVATAHCEGTADSSLRLVPLGRIRFPVGATLAVARERYKVRRDKTHFFCRKETGFASQRNGQRGIPYSPFGIPLKRPKRGLRPPPWMLPGERDEHCTRRGRPLPKGTSFASPDGPQTSVPVPRPSATPKAPCPNGQGAFFHSQMARRTRRRCRNSERHIHFLQPFRACLLTYMAASARSKTAATVSSWPGTNSARPQATMAPPFSSRSRLSFPRRSTRAARFS